MYGVTKHNHYAKDEWDLKRPYKYGKIFEDYAQYIPLLENIVQKYKLRKLDDLRKDKGRGYIYRDYIQASHADAVYAITPIHPIYGVSGGTRYAVYVAIDMGKPVYVWDTNTEEWHM
jgi:hypothetical protein